MFGNKLPNKKASIPVPIVVMINFPILSNQPAFFLIASFFTSAISSFISDCATLISATSLLKEETSSLNTVISLAISSTLVAS